jgi:hypothetical protein
MISIYLNPVSDRGLAGAAILGAALLVGVIAVRRKTPLDKRTQVIVLTVIAILVLVGGWLSITDR